MRPLIGSSWIWNSLAALSLANFCFLSVWRELLFANTEDAYWMPDYTSESYLAIILNVFAIAFIVYVLIHYVFQCPWQWLARLGRLIFLATLLIPLSYLQRALKLDGDSIQWVIDFWWISLPVIGAFGLVGFYLFVFRLRRMTQIVTMVCLILSPFALMNLANAAWFGIRLGFAGPLATISIQKPGGGSKQRVLWLLMDELDLVAFIDRPEGPVLPEFNRLRNQAFFAHETISYSRGTREAIPSFLLQRMVRRAEPTGPADLHLKFMEFEHLPDTDFAGLPNFFEDAAARGVKMAILGFYHPYCRLFREEAAYCRRYALETYSPYATKSVLREAWSQIVGITPLFSTRISAIKTYMEMTKEIAWLSGDPSFSLIYMHAPVPHGPGVWDIRGQQFTLFSFAPFYTAEESYFGNLVLADRLLGVVRSNMERAGLWDSTVVLVTSDHGWKELRERNIPFLLKLPGQRVPFEFERTFAPMRVTKDLLLEVLERKLLTPEAVAEWLELRISEESAR